MDIPYKEADIDFIKKQIDFIVDMGVYWIELGVLIGDVLELNHQTFKETIEYLENHQKVEGISFASSFIFLSDKHIEAFNLTDKINCVLSLYGKNDTEYKEITQISNGVTTLLRNLDKLQKVTSKMSITVVEMYPEKLESNVIFDKIKEIDTIKFMRDSTAPFTNWKNMLVNKKIGTNTKQGVCMYLYTDSGIDENGDVLACAWFDYKRFLKLGNIYNDSPMDVKERHNKIVDLQRKGLYTGACTNCEVFSTETNIFYEDYETSTP
jgi:radical SAM protein with 4Fe4S-binding SPASM domain